MLRRWCVIFFVSHFLCACGSAAEKKSSYVEMAKVFIQDENLTKARLAIKNALTISPNDPHVFFLSGQLAEKEANWPNALNQYAKTVDLDPTHRKAIGRLEQLYFAAQESHELQGLNTFPPLAALINVYLERKRPEQAKVYLEKVITQYPQHQFANGLLGAALWQLKDKPAALLAYERQTQVNPEWIEPWKDWAALQWSEGNKAKAINILKTALTQNENSRILLDSLASYYQADDQVDLTMRQYEAILRHNPTDIMAANNLAYLLADKNGDPQSLEMALSLTKHFETKTQNPFLLDTLAWVYYKMGHHKKATNMAKKALDKAPDHELINYHFGLMTLKTGDRLTAKKHLEKATHESSALENIEHARRLLAKIQL